MRTTLRLDDDACRLAKNYAEIHEISLGKAVSALARRGAAAGLQFRREDTLVLPVLPEGFPRVTTEQVKKLELGL